MALQFRKKISTLKKANVAGPGCSEVLWLDNDFTVVKATANGVLSSIQCDSRLMKTMQGFPFWPVTGSKKIFLVTNKQIEQTAF